MCVLAFAWRAHPRWPLVMFGNRDELHARPTAPLARWDDLPVIAGRDLLSGGTWLGVAEAGRFAVVTNLRGFGMPAPDRASRGALVTDMLAGEGEAADPAHASLDGYNPFNLIVADPAEAWFLTDRPAPARTRLAPGIYGLSNGRLDEPWPKTLRLKAVLLDWLMGEAEGPGRLLDALAERALPDEGARAAPPSEVPQEPAVSPVFILNPVYGTRCSTVVAIDAEGHGQIAERRYAADGAVTGETALDFLWPEVGN